jgi:hypothetical protein
MEDIGCQEYEVADNKVTISTTFQSNNKTVVELYGVISNGEVFDIFFNKIRLPIKEHTSRHRAKQIIEILKKHKL